MAKVVVPAGTKVTTDRGDTGTLAQAWDGKSLRVVINSDKRGRIEVHPSRVYVNGRSLQDFARGNAMAADAIQPAKFSADTEAKWKAWYDRRTAGLTIQAMQQFRERLLELADQTENRPMHTKAVDDAKKLERINVPAGTSHAAMKPLFDLMDRWPGIREKTLQNVLNQWQDIAAGRA
jgi:hypothetical protein